jgi:hypothetical protein
LRRALVCSLQALTLAALSTPSFAADLSYPACGTTAAHPFAPRAVQAAPPPGTLLLAIQDPPTVDLGFKGRIRYQLAVFGDFETIHFEIQSFTDLRSLSAERRDTYVNPRGEVISWFDYEGTLEEWLVLPWSWDVDLTSPLVFSEVLYLGPQGSEQPIFLPLNVLPRNAPRSKVVRRGARLQYASHLINVALPDLHHNQLDAPPNIGFDPDEVIEVVQRELGDLTHDEFGLGIWQHELTNPGAFHVSRPGGPGPPYSVYSSVAFSLRGIWTHEVNHNWSFRYDLPRLVGWSAPFDGFHGRGTVAREAGFLCCGGYPKERRGGQWRTTWIRDSHPFHPLELFAMGLIGAHEVPEMFVFERQDLDDFRPYEPLPGPTRRLTVERVIGEYGMPAPATQTHWHAVPVLVSESLLPRKTVSALNYFMRRMEDPEARVPGSFDAATGYRMDLRTSVEAPGLAVPKPPRDVTFPPVGKREIPGIALSRALPGCLVPGEKLLFQGRATTGAIPRLALVPSNPDHPTLEAAELQSRHFSVEWLPLEEDAYQVRVEGVWPRDEPLPVLIGPIYVTADCR